MKCFLSRATIFTAGACLLAGCAGGGPADAVPESASQVCLDGNWFAERQDGAGIVDTGERLIKESGTRFLVTYCDRRSELLTRSGSQLFDRDGKLHYLYIRDPATLASRPELAFNTIIRKRSTAGRFASGSVGLTLPSGEALSADTDVCAETSTGRYEDAIGNQLAPSIVTLSMPYRDSYIRVAVAFRQLSIGRYDVIGFEPFVQGGANVATISDFSSPSFVAQHGGESVSITSGTIQISNYTATSVSLSAELKTAAGVPLKFAANVKLQARS